MTALLASKWMVRPTWLGVLLMFLIAACNAATPASSGSSPEASNSPNAGPSSPASQGPAAPADLLPDWAKTAGVLAVGSDISSSYRPFEFYDENNKPAGFDIDLVQELAMRLDVEMPVSDIVFDGLIPALKSKRFDVMVSGAADTAERQQEANFIDYAVLRFGFLQRADDPRTLTALSDLCGLKVYSLTGSSTIELVRAQSDKCVAEGKAPIDAGIFDTVNDAVLAVSTSRADVFTQDMDSFANIADAGDFRASVAEDIPAINRGIGVRKEDMDLALAIQAAIQAMIDDGSYGKLIEKWGLTSAPVDRATINVTNP